MTRTSVVSAVVAISLLISAEMSAREGFGMSKRAAKMNRQVPPEVDLPGETIDVRLSKKGTSEQAAETFRDLVEAKMISFDERLKVDSSRPDVIVQLAFDTSDFQETWETKSDTEYKQTGEKQEWNSKKGKYETKPVYGNVTVNKNIKKVKGRVSAGYEAIDPHKKQTLHAATVESSFDKSFESGTGSPAKWDVEKQLLDQAADKVAAQLVGSIELVSVLLARGSFDSFVPLAEQGAWDRYFTAVQSVPEKNRPNEEAYRQYALGVASEAMAYRESDPAKALSYLRTAETHYLKASQLKPDEKFFTQPYANVWTGGAGTSPVRRVKSGIANYERFSEFEAASLTTDRSSARVATASKRSPSSKLLRNESLIEMAKAGLSDENITLAIESASGTEFDLSADGLIALSRGGVSRNVIAFIQKRAQKRANL